MEGNINIFADLSWKICLYEILPALDLTQSVHAKLSIGMHRGVKFRISRIPFIIGLETRLG